MKIREHSLVNVYVVAIATFARAIGGANVKVDEILFKREKPTTWLEFQIFARSVITVYR